MQRVAIFVDAAYLFTQGGASLAGSRQERSDLLLDVPNVVSELKLVAASRAPTCSLLRIYWYDGAGAGGHHTSDQAMLGSSDDVKLRLGFIGGFGQHKGIASMIVADLIELARQQAVCDAVLLSGDEDLRVGVQIAQSFGVRLHLLGVAPSRASQASSLLHEVDTSLEWQREVVGRFLSLRRSAAHAPSFMHPTASAAPFPPLTDPRDWEPRLEVAAREFVETLEDGDLDALEAYWTTSRGVPSELDRRLLPHARVAIGRDLDQPEKRFVRSCFQKYVMQRFEEDYEEVD